MFDIFAYSFIVRGLEAGVMVALIAPLIGIFLVLRRYSLIADTLAHVSLAGVALGYLTGISPMLTAIGVTVLSSLGIEKLRTDRRVYGEAALALFLSGSLALATVLLSIGNGFRASLFNYLFGSILTVSQLDVYVIGALAILIALILIAHYKELMYISFDEEAARVSGIPVKRINTILIVLAALTISLSIPVVGILLIAALIVIPVVAALQLRQSFTMTVVYAEIISVVSVVSGIIASYYLDVAASGMIVLMMLAMFLSISFLKRS